MMETQELRETPDGQTRRTVHFFARFRQKKEIIFAQVPY